jgi:hypothetical protein
MSQLKVETSCGICQRPGGVSLFEVGDRNGQYHLKHGYTASRCAFHKADPSGLCTSGVPVFVLFWEPSVEAPWMSDKTRAGAMAAYRSRHAGEMSGALSLGADAMAGALRGQGAALSDPTISPRASEPAKACDHTLRVDDERDGYRCAGGCGLFLDGRMLHALMTSKGWSRTAKVDHAGAERAIADAMSLRSENTSLLAENARLRRQLERGRK